MCAVLFDGMLAVSVCVCVCGRARMFVFIHFHLLVSSGYTNSATYVSISRDFWQVPSSLCLNLSYLTSKDDWLLERKRYDMFALEKMIYIGIGYKSAHCKNR